MKKLIRIVIEVSLSPRQKEVVDLYYMQGKKMPEISKILHISIQAVSSYLKAGRRKIEKIKKYF